MKPILEDSTLQLVGGMIDVVKAVIATLEAQGVLDRQALAYAVDRILQDRDPDDLTAAPLAALLHWLRPSDPPRPQLRLIRGGRSE
jgi:hypothetical protein